MQGAHGILMKYLWCHDSAPKLPRGFMVALDVVMNNKQLMVLGQASTAAGSYFLIKFDSITI